ncbi:arylsulfatase [Prolixibacteraceae bacterium JC049]|nr:arylsulfatase [Prolixibacteraceae bacterium JC049]
MLLSVSCSVKTDQKTQTNSKKQPNIIVIFTDDMGYGDLSCYGHPNIKTPNIDQMAEEGIRFTSFYAASSVCTPSRAALLTGRHPIRHAWYNFGPESKNGLPLKEVTIANLLKDKGYETMAIGKWHLGHRSEYLPTARGFDHFYGLPYSNDMILPWCPWLTEKDRLFLYEDDQPTKEIGFNQENLTVDYTRKATEFIRLHKDQPFFLYLAHSMPHLPISTSKEFIGKSKGGLYGDVIETIDWSVGEVQKAIKEAGLDENTIVIFTSDNGPWQDLPERMLQRGVKPWHAGSAGMLRGSKMTTYEGGFRVPAIVRWPKTAIAGKVNNSMITTMDMFATIAEVAGVTLPADRKYDGASVLPNLKSGNFKGGKPLFYCQGDKLQAIRKGEWKLRCTEKDGIQLFNMKSDPSEKYNMAKEKEEIVKQLYTEMKQFASETVAKLEDVDGV